MNLITQAEILEVLRYEDGDLYWIKTLSKRIVAGRRAGGIQSTGYIKTGFKGKTYQNSRLIWIMHHGDIPAGYVVDHINRDRSDNRLENLRLATIAENNYNMKAQRNKWGFRGVSRVKNSWCSTIHANGKAHYLGVYPTKLEAARAYSEAARELHGEFAYA